MRRFTEAGRQALASDNLYAALSLALTIPDICASLEDPGPGKSHKRYKRWYEKWALPKFSSEGKVFITADDCYQLRCSLIHSGSAEIDTNKRDILHRFVFFDKSNESHLNHFQSLIINGVDHGNFLQLSANKFSETIYDAAEEWDQAARSDVKIQAEKAKLLVIRSKGFTIGGSGGVRFG